MSCNKDGRYVRVISTVQTTASVLYPAGWFAWIFGKAQQQVQNRPAMLQNTLSTETKQQSAYNKSEERCSTLGLNFRNIALHLCGRPASGASCAAQRTELRLILSSVLTLQQNRRLSWAALRNTRAHFTQRAGCVKIALPNKA